MRSRANNQIPSTTRSSLPTNTAQDVWVGWDEYHALIERLALQIHASHCAFDQILCLARGGLRVGDILSRIFDKPLAILTTSSYRAAAGTEQGRLDIAEFVTMTSDRLTGRVLVVDDMVDTGVTLEKVCQHLRTRFTGITELKTGVLWFKTHSCVVPDFYVERLETNPWIHQPFEVYDTIEPAHLQARLGE
jgi:hypoxanthine phosphoribosyltransferase